jgi:hypothetical protein
LDTDNEPLLENAIFVLSEICKWISMTTNFNLIPNQLLSEETTLLLMDLAFHHFLIEAPINSILEFIENFHENFQETLN